MDDFELVNECVKGNPMAQKMLFDKFAPKMFVVCLRYIKQTDQAEDALQDGMIKVFSKIASFKNEGVLEGWIRRIIVNTCLDQIRKNLKFQTDVSLGDIEYKLGNVNGAVELWKKAKATGDHTEQIDRKINDRSYYE